MILLDYVIVYCENKEIADSLVDKNVHPQRIESHRSNYILYQLVKSCKKQKPTMDQLDCECGTKVPSQNLYLQPRYNSLPTKENITHN